MNELTKLPSAFLQDQFEQYLSPKEIEQIIDSLARTINHRYQAEELVIIGVLKGSCVFISDLLKKIRGVKLYLDFVHIGQVGRSKENNGTIVIKKDISTNILNKNVLIVEEVIDTGRAIHFLKNRLLESNPRSAHFI